MHVTKQTVDGSNENAVAENRSNIHNNIFLNCAASAKKQRNYKKPNTSVYDFQCITFIVAEKKTHTEREKISNREWRIQRTYLLKFCVCRTGEDARQTSEKNADVCHLNRKDVNSGKHQ
jgi:hypothetical protein